MGRAAAVILFLATVAAAAPFAPGTRFFMAGMDGHISRGRIYSYPADSAFSSLDPYFRVSVDVSPNFALGADLALLHTFPRHRNLFLNSPVFAFGPVATWLPKPSDRMQAYATAGVGIVYKLMLFQAWRFRLSTGALFDIGLPVSFGPEIGWYADWERVPVPSGIQPIWLSGSSFYLGFRLSDFRL